MSRAGKVALEGPKRCQYDWAGAGRLVCQHGHVVFNLPSLTPTDELLLDLLARGMLSGRALEEAKQIAAECDPLADL